MPVLFKYVVHYADGERAEVPVLYGEGTEHWLSEDVDRMGDGRMHDPSAGACQPLQVSGGGWAVSGGREEAGKPGAAVAEGCQRPVASNRKRGNEGEQ